MASGAWWTSLVALVLAAALTVVGIVWSIPGTGIDGIRGPTRWERFRAAGALGAGLLCTTAAGLAGLLGTPH